MDLLTTTGVVLSPRRRPLRVGVALSAIVHASMGALLLAMPVREFVADAPIEVAVDVVADLAIPQAPPTPAMSSPPARPGGLAPRLRAAPRPSRSAAPVPERAPSLPGPAGVVEDPAPEEAPPAAAAPRDSSASSGAAETDAPGRSSASPDSTGIASGGGRRSGAAVGGPGGGDPAGHGATVDRYRTELLGTRIRQVFRYPGEARDLELAGRVLLKVSIGRDGRLLDVRLAGRCPHAVLCADGLRTIRAAAPFPPIPAELGPSITVEVPLTYAFASE